MDVLCVGILVADVIAYPLQAFNFKVDATKVDKIFVQSGGDALNTAINLGRLGVKTAIVGKVGNDVFGKFLVGQARSAGVITDNLKITEDESTSAVIALVKNTGERAFIYHGGANDNLSVGDIDLGLIRKTKVLHFGGVFNTPSLMEGDGITSILEHAKALGKTTAMDVTWDSRGGWLKILKPSLPYFDFFMPSIAEAAHITGQKNPESMAKFLLDQGVKTVVIKTGKTGCYVHSWKKGFHVPGFTVARVVDTTGAGDAFVAGFLTGLIREWDLKKCARFANAAGALCVRALGTTAGVKDFETVSNFLSNKFKGSGTCGKMN